MVAVWAIVVAAWLGLLAHLGAQLRRRRRRLAERRPEWEQKGEPRPEVATGGRWGITLAELRRRGVRRISGPFEIPGYGIFEVEEIDLSTNTLRLVALIGAGEAERLKGGMPK